MEWAALDEKEYHLLVRTSHLNSMHSLERVLIYLSSFLHIQYGETWSEMSWKTWSEIHNSQVQLLYPSAAAGVKVKSQKKSWPSLKERIWHPSSLQQEREARRKDRRELHVSSSLSGSDCFILFQVWWVTRFIVHHFPCHAKLWEKRWMRQRSPKKSERSFWPR